MTVPRQKIPVKKTKVATVADFLTPIRNRNTVRCLFENISRTTLETLASRAFVYKAQPHVLLREQDESSTEEAMVPLWYIVEGHLHVERTVQKRNVVVGSLSPGQLCGEVENLLGIPSQFGISSAESVTFIEFTDPAMVLNSIDPLLLKNLCISFAEKLRDRGEKAGIRRGKDIAAILKDHLMHIVKEVGVRKKTRVVNIQTTLTALSAQLGVSRQSIKNAFDTLPEFEFQKGTITVRDRRILQVPGIFLRE